MCGLKVFSAPCLKAILYYFVKENIPLFSQWQGTNPLLQFNRFSFCAFFKLDCERQGINSQARFNLIVLISARYQSDIPISPVGSLFSSSTHIQSTILLLWYGFGFLFVEFVVVSPYDFCSISIVHLE